MIVDMRAVIAARCPWCGNIQLTDVNPFQLTGGSRVEVDCECGEELFTLAREKSGSYSLKIACIACDNKHIYRLGYKDLWKQEVHILCCQHTGLEICFLGSGKHVVETLNRYEEELDKLIEELGLEETADEEDFWTENFSQFMDSIDRINYDEEFGKNNMKGILEKPKRSK